MTTAATPPTHRWFVSEDSAGLLPQSSGTAPTAEDAWAAAFAVGRDALLSGRIRHLAIAVDYEIPQLIYSPARDHSGALIEDVLIADLLELRRVEVGAELGERGVAAAVGLGAALDDVPDGDHPATRPNRRAPSPSAPRGEHERQYEHRPDANTKRPTTAP